MSIINGQKMSVITRSENVRCIKSALPLGALIHLLSNRCRVESLALKEAIQNRDKAKIKPRPAKNKAKTKPKSKRYIAKITPRPSQRQSEDKPKTQTHSHDQVGFCRIPMFFYVRCSLKVQGNPYLQSHLGVAPVPAKVRKDCFWKEHKPFLV